MKLSMKNELLLEGARQRLLDLERQRLEIYQAFPQLSSTQAETKLRGRRTDPKTRYRVAKYAEKHGISEASSKYGYGKSTIHKWMHAK